MEHFLGTLLGGTHGVVAYVVVFSILVLCGLGLPLPEDVSLILGGYLAYSNAVRADVMVLICFLGILSGDSCIFFWGRRVGRSLKPNSWIGKLVTPEKLRKVENLFARWGQKIVMAARFMPGVRAGVYFAAGASGLPYWRFIIFDGLAACLSAPLFVLGGKHFGGEITHFIMVARRAQMAVFATALALVVGYVMLQRQRQKRATSPAAPSLPAGKVPESIPAAEQRERAATAARTSSTVASRTTH